MSGERDATAMLLTAIQTSSSATSSDGGVGGSGSASGSESDTVMSPGCDQTLLGRTNKTLAPVRFLAQLYTMLEEDKYTECISWSEDGTSFTVSNPQELEQKVLPGYYKSTKFSSFQRQLNYFGFKKVKKRGYMYTHAQFMRGHRDKLIEIKRKPNTGNLKKRKVRQVKTESPRPSAASGKSPHGSPRNSKRQKAVPRRFDNSASPEGASSPRHNSTSSSSKRCSTSDRSSSNNKDGNQKLTAAASMVMLLLGNDKPKARSETASPNLHRSIPLPSPATVPIEGTAPPSINININRSSDIDSEAVMLLTHAHSPRRTIEMTDRQSTASLAKVKDESKQVSPQSPLSPQVAIGQI